jgi:YtxH-like protein
VNKLLKTLLRTGVYFLDQADDATAPMRDRVKHRTNDFADRATAIIRGRQDHTVRYAVSFAAGIGLGLGAGLLFAPASGDETREILTDKVHDFGQSVRERFSTEASSHATGTDGQ